MAVPTGNLTRFSLFDKIYMSTDDEVVRKDMIMETVGRQGVCVVYIATDTYWLNGLNADDVLERALKNRVAVYEKVAEGSLGEFYYVHK